MGYLGTTLDGHGSLIATIPSPASHSQEKTSILVLSYYGDTSGQEPKYLRL